MLPQFGVLPRNIVMLPGSGVLPEFCAILPEKGTEKVKSAEV